jgi:hypothetical protein
VFSCSKVGRNESSVRERERFCMLHICTLQPQDSLSHHQNSSKEERGRGDRLTLDIRVKVGKEITRKECNSKNGTERRGPYIEA